MEILGEAFIKGKVGYFLPKKRFITAIAWYKNICTFTLLNNYITHIEIEGLFGEKDIRFSPDPKVNVLAGINGSGKSTVLRCLFYLVNYHIVKKKNKSKIIQHDANATDHIGRNVYPMDFPLSLVSEKIDLLKIHFNNEGFCKIDWLGTFDLPPQSYENGTESSSGTQLDIILKHLINGDKNNDICYNKVEAKHLKEATSFYRNGEKERGDIVLKPIDNLLATINSFFSDSNKKIESVNESDKRLQIINQNGEVIDFEKLSTGEKQILIILFTVFLQEKEPTIFLLDEPEVTLHIKWQRNLIDAILKINPNVQLFIATHASSIFFNGYQDKLILMEDISFPMKTKESVE